MSPEDILNHTPWPWQVDHIVRDFLEEGFTPEELAVAWECHPETVRRKIRENNLREELDATG